MMKHNSTWLLSCLALGILITSCSGKKNDVDKQEQSVSTVLPDAALRRLQIFLSTIPQCDNTKYEGHY